jgi:hypothetical protein
MPRLANLTPVERLRTIGPHLDRGEALLKRALRPQQLFVRKAAARGVSASESRLSELVMLLDCFDRCIEDLVGYKAHIYLLGDCAVSDVVRIAAQRSAAKPAQLTEDLDVLSTCGLVYRFNVALKFGYPERSLVQVRLNGWGRHLVEHTKWPDSASERRSCERLMAVLRPFAGEYREQIGLCGSSERPLRVRRIHLLNRKLPIRVVT